MNDPSECLLAVDLGLRTGLAVFDRSGMLLWYRSRNYGNKTRLRKAARSVIDEAGTVHVVAIEGGGDIAMPWISEIERRGLDVIQCQAHVWRRDLLLSRHQRRNVFPLGRVESLQDKVCVSTVARPTDMFVPVPSKSSDSPAIDQITKWDT